MSGRAHPNVIWLRSLITAALLLPIAPLAASANSGDPLSTAVASAEAKLRKGWLSDPTSKALPFPKLKVLPDTAAIRTACPDRPELRQATGRAVYCPSLGTILVDQTILDPDSGSPEGALSYWIAMGLAEALTSVRGKSTSAPSAASQVVSSLENNCLSGILLAASGLTRQAPVEVMLAPAVSSFSVSKSNVVGSSGQRGYALLTGLGATDLSCSQSDMLALSQDKVPDPDVLTRISSMDRASSSLMAVLNSQCRPRPMALCPRRLNMNVSAP